MKQDDFELTTRFNEDLDISKIMSCQLDIILYNIIQPFWLQRWRHAYPNWEWKNPNQHQDMNENENIYVNLTFKN